MLVSLCSIELVLTADLVLACWLRGCSARVEATLLAATDMAGNAAGDRRCAAAIEGR